nr:MAG TPA: hypothetical protein [Caudoviricetes sp.]DAV39203.1 MAG TPA: hypothetical protein [Caudoviricetes sp.]
MQKGVMMIEMVEQYQGIFQKCGRCALFSFGGE